MVNDNNIGGINDTTGTEAISPHHVIRPSPEHEVDYRNWSNKEEKNENILLCKRSISIILYTCNIHHIMQHIVRRISNCCQRVWEKYLKRCVLSLLPFLKTINMITLILRSVSYE